MNVLVKLHGPFRKHLPVGAEGSSCRVEIREGDNVASILVRLGINEIEEMTIVRNHRRGRNNDLLGDGDVVAFFPPLSGGG